MHVNWRDTPTFTRTHGKLQRFNRITRGLGQNGRQGPGKMLFISLFKSVPYFRRSLVVPSHFVSFPLAFNFPFLTVFASLCHHIPLLPFVCESCSRFPSQPRPKCSGSVDFRVPLRSSTTRASSPIVVLAVIAPVLALLRVGAHVV